MIKTTSAITFSERVKNDLNYNPGYPAEVFSFLIKERILRSDSVIADLGSGSGTSAKPFVENGNTVYAVESDFEMRQAAEHAFALNKNFKSVDASAEATTLKAKSVDIVLIAQSYHLFSKDALRIEIERILKSDGYIVVLWNNRLTDETEFLMEYETLLHNYGVDFNEMNFRNHYSKDIRNHFLSFTDNKTFVELNFRHQQAFDSKGLQGRWMASAHLTQADKLSNATSMMELKRIFDTHNKEGLIRFEYDTVVYCGQLR